MNFFLIKKIKLVALTLFIVSTISLIGSILLHNAQTEEEKIYALELLRSAALAGDNDAASTLHHIYVSGLYNEPKNLCMASYWLDISKKKNRSDGVVSNTKAADCFVENELKISK